MTHKHPPTSTFTAPSAAWTTTATTTSCLARRRSGRHHSSRRHRRQILQVSQFAALFDITATINVTHHWSKSILLKVLLVLNFPYSGMLLNFLNPIFGKIALELLSTSSSFTRLVFPRLLILDLQVLYILPVL